MKNNGTEKKKSKAPIIVAAVVGLGIIGSAGNDSDDSKNTNRREERETTSITTTIVEETEWNIWEDEETTITLDFDENSKIITLIAGEQGEYGKMITYNKDTEFEENFYAYYVPYGTYKITNVGEYMTQVNVYSDEVVVNEDGWEEIADSVCNDVLDVEASLTVTIPKNYHVEICEPTHILMEQISDETVEAEVKPKVTTVTEEIVEDPIYEKVRLYLEDILKNSYPNAKIKHDKGTPKYEIEITLDGLKTSENPIKTEQDQQDWNEISAQFCETSLLLVTEAIEKGVENPEIILFVNSDDEIPKTVLTIMNGVVFFDELSYNNTTKTEKTVFITNTGKKYHSDSTCNGGNYFSATLAEAVSQGLKPCEKCIG